MLSWDAHGLYTYICAAVLKRMTWNGLVTRRKKLDLRQFCKKYILAITVQTGSYVHPDFIQWAYQWKTRLEPEAKGRINHCCYYICQGIIVSGSGPSSSDGIVTDYGLDGPGSNPDGDEIFRSSRPALEPTQPPVKWVPCLSRGKVRPGRTADHSPPSSAAVMEE